MEMMERNQNSSETNYDAVVIGAGLAGLAATAELKDLNVLILEKETKIGGRVQTRTQHGISYDLGAVFAFLPGTAFLPSALPEPVNEPAPIGLYFQGKTTFGTSVMYCLRQVLTDPSDLDSVIAFFETPKCDAKILTAQAYNTLNAFFRVIHPGNMRDYFPARQHDAFRVYDNRHFSQGNQVVVNNLREHTNAHFLQGVEVLSVAEEGNRVKVRFRENNAEQTVSGKAAIVSTPGTKALRMLRKMNRSCRLFLESLTYAEGSVVVLAFPTSVAMKEFSYLVTPELSSNTILKQTKDGAFLIYVYFVGEESAALAELEENEKIRDIFEIFSQVGLDTVSKQDLLFIDYRRWSEVGPIISSDSYTRWNDARIVPSSRVFLVGDYTHMLDRNAPMPYGMHAAAASGKQGAERLKQTLGLENASASIEFPPLIHSIQYGMTPHHPFFWNRRIEGDIAFYGLILKAQKTNVALKNYLLAQVRDHLWEYQAGYGVTTEDSALVLEGLLEAGVDKKVLAQSFRQLVALFYDPDSGSFQTLSHQRKEIPACAQGRAAYWEGPSVDATAQAAFLLHTTIPKTYAAEIENSRLYLKETQTAEGYWTGRWFPSLMISTYYSVRFLHQFGKDKAEIERACSYLYASQNRKGSWGESEIETAVAILTLRLCAPESSALPSAKAWLQAQKHDHGWSGEPVIYYWFEMKEQQKLFVQGIDKGPITTAWAELALR